MIFSDLWFFRFVVLTVAAVWIAPPRFKRLALLLGCLIFHAHYAGPAGMAPIIALAALTYFALQGAFNLNASALRKGAIIASVGALIYYKYFGLLNHLTGLNLALAAAAPLAISFFVFEFVHLLVDRSRHKTPRRLSPLNFSIFAIFFPSLASGPIKRYEQFEPELQRLGRPSWPLLSQSLFRILLGFYKKFCIADALSRDLPPAGTLGYWHSSVLILSVLQGARIFMDFSGYSDIAIGLAGLLNIRLPENFSFPYLATNISEFWRRWHISLSTWIRDYIYIVLGGNRVSNARRFINLLATMFVCGLWHGAAMHFALWGILHGLALLTVHFWKEHSPIRIPKAVAWAMTFTFVQASWLIFFYDSQELWELLHRSPLLI